MLPKDRKSQQLLAAYDANDPDPHIGTFLNKTKCALVAVYDFTVNGGAISTIPLLDDEGNPALLPPGSIVTNVTANVIIQPTSAGAATVGLGSNIAASTTDLMAQTAKASLTVGFLAGTPVGTAATWKGPVPASDFGLQVHATIVAAALTAGKIYYNIEYVINNLT